MTPIGMLASRCKTPFHHATAMFFLALAALATSVPRQASAQVGLNPSDLQISGPADCDAVIGRIGERSFGRQWLIGENVSLYGAPNARNPMARLGDPFEAATCYSQERVSGLGQRIFVTTDSRQCGWVSADDLLESFSLLGEASINSAEGDAVCAVPRAMPFSLFCERLAQIGTSALQVCEGVPSGLRAKGVLTGIAVAGQLTESYPFMTDPIGGTARSSRSFFSILEIHDVSAGERGTTMVLVGDGEGDLFGWIDLRALELWPTRLGLFYDIEGRGTMFQGLPDMISNWRNGTPRPNILSGLSVDELADYIHGSQQLVSYPIIRTRDPLTDPSMVRGDTGYHEVIFLGQVGEGSASQLISQSDTARALESLQQINVLLLLDTTESMRRYLPLVQDGIQDFIRSYQARDADRTNRMPEMRIGVMAYSDFENDAATNIGDTIRTSVLVSPSRVAAGFDSSRVLAAIERHRGLDDPVGEYYEAAFEAVVEAAKGFETEQAWFADGPRVIIHIADHSSRPAVDLNLVNSELERTNVYYFPIAVVTADEGEIRRTRARELFPEQAAYLFDRIVEGNATSEDVVSINLMDFEQVTQLAVQNALNLVLNQVLVTVSDARGAVTGGLARRTEPDQTVDRLSSRIELSDRLREQYGLDDLDDTLIVSAAPGFAPLLGRDTQAIDWTYTVALEPDQATELRLAFNDMCSNIGSPEQVRVFSGLLTRLMTTFSGDQVGGGADARVLLRDLSHLPGASESFVSQPVSVLQARAQSSDLEIRNDLRRDVCWTATHLTYMNSNIYALPDQLRYNGLTWEPLPGTSVVRREFTYTPVIGAETVYVPSFFFMLPSVILSDASAGRTDDCGILACPSN